MSFKRNHMSLLISKHIIKIIKSSLLNYRIDIDEED